MVHVCAVYVMDVVFYLCTVRRGAVDARVCENTAVACLCLVCIMWQFSMLNSVCHAVC